MSSRPLIAPNTQNPIINAVSMATSIEGPATVIQMLPGISYDLSWTGTPTGTFAVQVSNTVVLGPAGSVLQAGTWYDLPAAALVGTLPTATGAAGDGFIEVVGTQAYAVRLTYTAVSGTGNLTVVATAKVL
jgi:hypothetical protein